jgi:CHAD domain-containing protein
MSADLPFPPEQDRILTARDTLPEALRKILLGFLQNMLLQEQAIRIGEEIEGVHQMRVTTRRIRSLYQAFGHLMYERYRGEIPGQLKHTARVLGAVRDLDVFIMNTQAFIKRKRGEDRAALLALLTQLNQEHQVLRGNLIEWLDGDDYRGFVLGFFDVLTVKATTAHLPGSPSELTPISYEVRHMLPALLFEQFRTVRQYEVLMPTYDVPTLHRLRIHAKQLRYSLDAFQSVLGRPSGRVIGQVKHLQTYLGEMNDASVAAVRLDALCDEYSPQSNPAVDAYRAYYAARCDRYVAGFSAVWGKFNRQKVRHSLARALANL